MLFSKSYAKRLTELGLGPPQREVLCDIAQIESRASVRLPKSYKNFLKQCGGWWGTLYCDCTEPTPFGISHNIAGFHEADVVYEMLDSEFAPRNTIVIAIGNLKQYTLLSVAGIDYGSVYAFDLEYRAWWDDEKFYRRFPNLAAEIKEYLELRRADRLPEKHDTYGSLYHVANNFDEFLAKCRRV